MPEYLVEWNIQISAETPREAAEIALEIQRSASDCTFFKVTKAEEIHEIDLNEIEMEMEWEETHV